MVFWLINLGVTRAHLALRLPLHVQRALSVHIIGVDSRGQVSHTDSLSLLKVSQPISWLTR